MTQALRIRLFATVAVLIPVLVGAAVLHAATGGLRRADSPQIRTVASGSISVVNSRDGAAIFRLANIGPGSFGEGEVTITNSGTVPGSLALSSSGGSDSAGLYGGVLSERLHLEVSDVSGGASAPVYLGRFDAMPTQALGVLVAGASRTYRFRVSMVDGGAPSTPYVDDNLYQRASADINYDWALTEVEEAEEEAEPGKPPSAVPPAPPSPEAPAPLHSQHHHLVGTPHHDSLVGTSRDDEIYGLGANDLIRGLGGDDYILGGNGADSVHGGPGADRIRGGPGPDRIFGDAGPDLIYARDGEADSVDCGSGVDFAYLDERDSARGCESVSRL
jgi:Ca2+-binding RTX toxin-like protein